MIKDVGFSFIMKHKINEKSKTFTIRNYFSGIESMYNVVEKARDNFFVKD